jgi:hypothetical protein
MIDLYVAEDGLTRSAGYKVVSVSGESMEGVAQHIASCKKKQDLCNGYP